MYKPISTYTGRHFDPYHAVAADLMCGILPTPSL